MTTKTKEQPKHTLLRAVDKLDDLRLRLAFVSNGVVQSSDWIDESAAASLNATINSIWSEMGEVIKALDEARKAVRS